MSAGQIFNICHRGKCQNGLLWILGFKRFQFGFWKHKFVVPLPVVADLTDHPQAKCKESIFFHTYKGLQDFPAQKSVCFPWMQSVFNCKLFANTEEITVTSFKTSLVFLPLLIFLLLILLVPMLRSQLSQKKLTQQQLQQFLPLPHRPVQNRLCPLQSRHLVS